MEEYQRLLRATTELLADTSEEGQMFLHLLIDNELYGDELLFAIERAETYLRAKYKIQQRPEFWRLSRILRDFLLKINDETVRLKSLELFCANERVAVLVHEMLQRIIEKGEV